MRVNMSLNQSHELAEVLRDAIEAESFTVKERMRVAYPDNLAWHEGAELAVVDGAVRLHRLAACLLQMDAGWPHRSAA